MEIDELNRKRDIFSNDVNRIRKHKNNLKLILKDGRSNRNRADCGLEAKINTLLHKFDIKHEVFFCSKLNGDNCRRFMKHHLDIINGINEMCIDMSKGEVSDEDISKITNKYKKLLMEMDDVYLGIRTLSIHDILIDKTRIYI